MTRAYVLPVDVEPLEDGAGYLATCEAIQGCLAEGASVAEALEDLEDMAHILLELRIQDGLGIPEGLKEASGQALRLHAQILVSVGGHTRELTRRLRPFGVEFRALGMIDDAAGLDGLAVSVEDAAGRVAVPEILAPVADPELDA